MLVSEGIVKYSGDTLVSSLLKMSQTLVSMRYNCCNACERCACYDACEWGNRSIFIIIAILWREGIPQVVPDAGVDEKQLSQLASLTYNCSDASGVDEK